jgi:hypothetical protein
MGVEGQMGVQDGPGRAGGVGARRCARRQRRIAGGGRRGRGALTCRGSRRGRSRCRRTRCRSGGDGGGSGKGRGRSKAPPGPGTACRQPGPARAARPHLLDGAVGGGGDEGAARVALTAQVGVGGGVSGGWWTRLRVGRRVPRCQCRCPGPPTPKGQRTRRPARRAAGQRRLRDSARGTRSAGARGASQAWCTLHRHAREPPLPCPFPTHTHPSTSPTLAVAQDSRVAGVAGARVENGDLRPGGEGERGAATPVTMSVGQLLPRPRATLPRRLPHSPPRPRL